MIDIRVKILRSFLFVIATLFCVSGGAVALQMLVSSGYQETSATLVDDYELLEDTSQLTDAFNQLFKSGNTPEALQRYTVLRENIRSIIARKDANGVTDVASYQGVRNTVLETIQHTERGVAFMQANNIDGVQTSYDAAIQTYEFVRENSNRLFSADLQGLAATKAQADTLYSVSLFTGIGAILLAVLACILYAALLARQIVRPLLLLAETSEQIAAGNHDVKISDEVLTSHNELSRLGKALASMARDLKENSREIAAARKE